MTDINLKKIITTGFLAYLAILLIFTIGALDRILGREVFGVPLFWIYGGVILALTIAVALYAAYLKKRLDSGKDALGLRFLRMIHRYRFLMEQLVMRDFKIKYKRSVLGVFWSFLNPLLMMSVQYVVFSYLFKIRGNVEHYAIYLLCGIVIWNGFTDCSMQSMRSITGNAHLITKVYVPKYIYPISKVFSASINVMLSMIPLLLMTVVYGLFSNPHLYLSKAILLLPMALLLLLVFCVGVGFILSSLMVFFHDIEFLWSVFVTVWMYATPIIYSLDMFGEEARWLVTVMQFNPMYHYITFVRTIILERTAPSFAEMGLTVLISLVFFGVGLLVFRKSQDRFILYL
ncbi:MAG: ABC transporter permease [Lachnospiraceae bacterium]|nr:ABC transporter permease [Lachnospiraceae bacterium]